jgi:hypothetical protein
MEHASRPISIRARQGARDLLHDGIADRVGMADAFAFDDLDVEIGSLGSTRLLDMNAVHVNPDPR